MWQPRFEGDEHPPLYSNLRKSGFTKWATLPRETGFYSLFAFGLLLHTYTPYKELDGRVAWFLQQIKEIQAVDESLQDKSNRYETQDFWERLDVASRTLCASLFPSQQQISKKIMSDKESIFDFSNADIYNQIAAGLGMCLCLYEEDGQGRQTREFRKDSSSFDFVVCIASVGSECSVLIHKEFLFGQEVALPAASSLQIARPCSSDAIDALLISTINALTEIICYSTRQLPPSLHDDQESLRSIKANLGYLVQQTSLQISNLNLEMLARVAELPRSDQPRTVRTCELCQGEGETFTEQSHAFHSACLANYLNSLASRGTRQLVCPSENCRCILSEGVLDRFPSIRDRLRGPREAEHVCTGCARNCINEGLARLSHGCALCNKCGRLSLVEEVCERCKVDLVPADYEAIHSLIIS